VTVIMRPAAGLKTALSATASLSPARDRLKLQRIEHHLLSGDPEPRGEIRIPSSLG
jgi:hypothetical protein